jgi:2-isopropylmalate synthase
MALKTRADFYKIGTRVDTTKIFPASRMVSTLTGLIVQRNKAIVGKTPSPTRPAFHQDGVLKLRETYEIMNPADSRHPGQFLVLGKAFGPACVQGPRHPTGLHADEEQFEAAFVKFKALADKKKEVFDEDIEAIVDDQLELGGGLWTPGLQVTAGSNTIPTATVTMRDSNGEHAGREHRRRPSTRSIGDSAHHGSRSRSPTTTHSRGDEGEGGAREVQIELEHNEENSRRG